MAKRKDRYFDGVLLADHLYACHKGRPGYWRYKRPDQTYKTFRARDVHEANAIAQDANDRRHTSTLDRSSMSYAVERYIVHAERLRPSLKAKESWRNRCYAMRGFAKAFPRRTVTERDIWTWWDTLSHSQQILREAEFRRMWTWMLRESFVMTTANPFDRDRLLRREKPVSQRRRLSIEDFWRIYEQAVPGVQVAMGISLLTTMRRSDVVALTKANVQDGYLRKVISKSEEQRGAIKAARLQWKLSEHPELARLINRGIEMAPPGCDFIVNVKPKVRRHGAVKEHGNQVLPDRLSRLFAEARKDAGIDGDNAPTFHEVRSLGSFLLAQQGEKITDIQELMAHSDEAMTALYQSGHPLPWTTVEIRLHGAGGRW
jgi:integrase